MALLKFKMKHNLIKTLKKSLSRIPFFGKKLKVFVDKVVSWIDDGKYAKWLKDKNTHSLGVGEQIKLAEKFIYRPLISIVVPAYNTPKVFLTEMIDSVMYQTYDNWELIIVDDNSPDNNVEIVIKEYAERDSRIKYKFLDKNLNIAGATNEAIKMSSGKFVSFLDHDDLLMPSTLFEIVKTLNRDNKIDFIYTDEDKIVNGRRTQPFFKPDWNPDFLYSVNYITHFTTIRKSILDRVGHEDGFYNGAQDWELFLRVTSDLHKDRIYHIPEILYNWRVHDLSTAKNIEAKPYVIGAQRHAIEDNLKKHGFVDFKLNQDEIYHGQWQISFRQKKMPKVSIIINSDNAKNIILNIKENTNYKNYETFVYDYAINYSDILGVVDGEYLIFITKNISISNPNWIDVFLGDAVRPDIGFVIAGLNSNKDIMKLIDNLIDKDAAKLIKSVSRRNTAKHLYYTSRYNVKSVYDGVMIVEANKLRKLVVDNKRQVTDLSELSRLADNYGYRNLYNPYIKMIK